MTAFKTLTKRLVHRMGLFVRKTGGLSIGTDAWLQLQSVFGIRPDMVFDVGAHRGETVEQVRHYFPVAMIHCFEPHPQNFEALRARVAHLPNVSLHHVAVGSANGSASLSILADSQTHSLRDRAEAISKIDVRVETIDSVCQRLGVDAIDVLKIDTEGFECEVLQGATSLLSSGRIQAVLCEASLQADDQVHTSLASLRSQLEPHGLRLAGLFDQVAWSNPTRLAYFNALFVRS